MKQWSDYQKRIFNFVSDGVGSAIVEAVAGSGKTTTIVEALKSARGSTIFLAFNKSIAEELKARGVNARTFHSLTYGPVLGSKAAQSVDADKLRKLVQEKWEQSQRELYMSFVIRLVGLGRQIGIGCLVPDSPDVWHSIIEHHDLELEHEAASYAHAVQLASDLLEISCASPSVDFDDLLYLAVRDGISLPKFDFIFVDEAQDTNAIQRAILKKIMKPNSRLVAVGDPAQAIYGFRGADSDSLDLIAQEFGCQRLPLTVSYRCPTAVIAHAKNWVSHIEPAPNAPAGEVTELGEAWNPDSFAASDLVVCRTTKPLIELAYSLLRAQKPAFIVGKDIGAGMKSLIKKLNAKGIDALMEKLERWRERETEKARVKNQDAKVESINDKADALLVIIGGLSETERTVSGLITAIDKIFSEKANATKLATIHKAKGLEADKVFWLNYHTCPAKWARQNWQKQQERNLCYVATTRAKQSLILISNEMKTEA